MLCGTNDYGVAIHSGQRSRAERQLDYELRNTWYLFGLESGSGSFNGRALQPPTMLLLPPRSGRLRFPSGAGWEFIAFDLRRVPLQRTNPDHPHSRSLCHVHNEPQPDGRALWGDPPPIEIPADERPMAMNCLRSCGRLYWRSASSWARANAQLQLWVTDYATRGSDDDARGTKQKWLRPILSAIDEGLASGISVAECARLAGMSRQTFHRRFSEAVHELPSEYIFRMRMEEAARLLEVGNEDVARIARLTGYRSPETFSNQFLKHHGCRPSRYRRLVHPSG